MLLFLLLILCFFVVFGTYKVRSRIRLHSMEVDYYIAQVKKHNNREREASLIIRQATVEMAHALTKEIDHKGGG